MAKKKSINLSALIKQYDIKDDITQTNQYGLGSFLKNNAVPLLKTGAGAALTATGAAAPVGIGLMASGVGEIASNELAENPEQAAAMQAGSQLAGTVGSLGAQGTFNSQLAQGGELTQYNGGGTHQENPRGGIDIGPNAQVEDKETRWEDYIFSDRIKIPGKNYTFAEASKKIDTKYKRDNDSFEKKAKEKEMKALMSMQEMEREKMNAAHNAAMQKAFGGSKDGEQDDLLNTNGKITIPQDTIVGNSSRANDLNAKFAKQNQNAINITPGTQVKNTLKLLPRKTELRSKYGYLNEDVYSPQFDETGTKVIGDDIANKRKAELDAQEIEYRRKFAPLLGVPVHDKKSSLEEARKIYPNYDSLDPAKKRDIISSYVGLPNFREVDPNIIFDKSKLPKEDLKKFYDILYEKQAIRDAQGFRRKEYYGPTEAKQMGYTTDTPLEDLNLGIRFLTGAQNAQIYDTDKKAYGGKVQYNIGGGLNLEGFNAINNTINPNVGDFANYSTQGQFNQNALNNPNNMYNNYTTLNDYNKPLDNGVAASNLALDEYMKSSNPNMDGITNSGDNAGKFDWGQAAMFGVQNIGNLYNIGKGLQGAEQVNLGQINPKRYDYSNAIKNASDTYASAASRAREAIRKTATSSGQALSNLIASESSLSKNKEAAIRSIMEQQNNQNTSLANQAEQYNLGLRNQESQINSQNEAMKDQFLAQGISGIGNNIAQFNRDNKADRMQQGYIENLLKTGNYEIDPVTGKVRLIGSNNE